MAQPAVKDTTTSLPPNPPNPPVPPTTATPPAPRPVKPLAQGRLRLVNSSSSDVQNHWCAVLPAEIGFEAALEPSFFSAHADKLRVGDVIDISCDSRSWFGSVYVRDVSRTRILVGRLGYHEFDALSKSATDPSLYRIEFRGSHLKWVIESVADGRAVREGFESKEAAEVQLKGLERSQDRKVA
jgi:hypothetical protein